MSTAAAVIARTAIPIGPDKASRPTRRNRNTIITPRTATSRPLFRIVAPAITRPICPYIVISAPAPITTFEATNVNAVNPTTPAPICAIRFFVSGESPANVSARNFNSFAAARMLGASAAPKLMPIASTEPTRESIEPLSVSCIVRNAACELPALFSMASAIC